MHIKVKLGEIATVEIEVLKFCKLVCVSINYMVGVQKCTLITTLHLTKQN